MPSGPSGPHNGGSNAFWGGSSISPPRKNAAHIQPIAPADATSVKAPDPVMDKLVAKDKDSTNRYNRATKAQFGDTDAPPNLAKMDVRFNSNLGASDETVQSLENVANVADKQIANRAALNAYKKNK